MYNIFPNFPIRVFLCQMLVLFLVCEEGCVILMKKDSMTIIYLYLRLILIYIFWYYSGCTTFLWNNIKAISLYTFNAYIQNYIVFVQPVNIRMIILTIYLSYTCTLCIQYYKSCVIFWTTANNTSVWMVKIMLYCLMIKCSDTMYLFICNL